MKTAASILLLAVLAASPALAAQHPAPPATGGSDIVDTAVAAGGFETLAAALGAAKLVDTLKGDGPFTVFAPTDAAFAKLPQSTVQQLLQPQNRDQLVKVLTYHVVPGRVSSADALGAMQADTVQGASLSFRIEEGRFFVNDSGVVANDLQASNGTIHVVDTVLLPPGGLDLRPAGRLVIGIYDETPSAALAAQLGLDRHKSMMITGFGSSDNAREAGLQKYDVIVEIDGMPATDANLKKAKNARGAGGVIELVVIRKAQRQHIGVEVGVDRH